MLKFHFVISKLGPGPWSLRRSLRLPGSRSGAAVHSDDNDDDDDDDDDEYRMNAHCIWIGVSCVANLPSLVDRRQQRTKRFFSRICDANNCLHYLLPQQRHSRITNSHRTAKKYPVPLAKITRFKNFILYALANFQWLVI